MVIQRFEDKKVRGEEYQITGRGHQNREGFVRNGYESTLWCSSAWNKNRCNSEVTWKCIQNDQTVWVRDQKNEETG